MGGGYGGGGSGDVGSGGGDGGGGGGVSSLLTVHIVWPVTVAGPVEAQSLRTDVEVRLAVTALVELSTVRPRAGEHSRHLRTVKCPGRAEAEKQRESGAQHC